MTLNINPEYEALLPKLPKEEYEALKVSIEKEGQHYPIIVNDAKIILDGHTRYQICLELNKEPKYETKLFENTLSEKKFVIESNLLRRQLGIFQRFEMSLPLLAIKRGLSKQRMLLGKEDPTLNLEEGEAVEHIAPIIGMSPALYYQSLWLVKNAPLEELEKLRSGKRAISNLYNTLKSVEDIKNSVVLSVEDVLQLEKEVNVLQGDFRERSKAIPNNSINLILTDPPYGAQALDLWDALGKLASRVLVEGGFLVSYSGQLYLPKVFESLSQNLEYYWMIALRLKERNLITARNIFSIWKPILIFYKPPLKLNPKYLVDVIDGQGAEKDKHKWQQAESELHSLIEYFCPKKGVILDPMAGSGTTLVAAKKLGRQFIGIELQQNNLPTIKERLSSC